MQADPAKMNRKPGDWDCGSCLYLNFSRRDLCQKCGEPRPGNRGEYAGGGSGVVPDVRPGDWYCLCGYHNFASRGNCHNCGAFSDEYAAGLRGGDGDAHRPRVYGRVGWKSGDWMCPRYGCNMHNYASRVECFKCHAPRGTGTDDVYGASFAN